MALIACSRSEAVDDRQAEDAVFAAVIDDGCREKRGDRVHLISDRPAVADFFERPNGAPIPAEVRHQIREREKSPRRWPHLVVCAEQQIVDGMRIDQLLTQRRTVPPDWTDLYQVFPGMIDVRRFSRVAFSSDGKLAHILAERDRENVSSSGALYELRLAEGRWLVSRVSTLWIYSF